MYFLLTRTSTIVVSVVVLDAEATVAGLRIIGVYAVFCVAARVCRFTHVLCNKLQDIHTGKVKVYTSIIKYIFIGQLHFFAIPAISVYYVKSFQTLKTSMKIQ